MELIAILFALALGIAVLIGLFMIHPIVGVIALLWGGVKFFDFATS